MIRNPHIRRVLSLLLMLAGGVLIFLVPDDFRLGVVLLGLGLALEVAGTLLQRRTGK